MENRVQVFGKFLGSRVLFIGDFGPKLMYLNAHVLSMIEANPFRDHKLVLKGPEELTEEDYKSPAYKLQAMKKGIPVSKLEHHELMPVPQELKVSIIESFSSIMDTSLPVADALRSRGFAYHVPREYYITSEELKQIDFESEHRPNDKS